MSDPISSATNDPQQHPPPKNKEDQKAAAALESLNTVTSGISGDRSVPAASAAAGAEALGKAMSRLEIAGGQEGKKKVNVKVAVEDVGLLVFDTTLLLSSFID